MGSKTKTKTKARTQTEDTSTSPFVSNARSGCRKCIYYIIWTFKMLVSLVSILACVLHGKAGYKHFLNDNFDDESFLNMFAIMSTIFLAIAVWFEHKCTLFMVMVMGMVSFAYHIKKMKGKIGLDEKLGLIIVDALLLIIFSVYVLLLCCCR